MSNIIATIDLDNDDGLGKLFWKDGDIWCREENGNEYPTHTLCKEGEAADTIAHCWSYGGWNLQFVN